MLIDLSGNAVTQLDENLIDKAEEHIIEKITKTQIDFEKILVDYKNFPELRSVIQAIIDESNDRLNNIKMIIRLGTLERTDLLGTKKIDHFEDMRKDLLAETMYVLDEKNN